MCLALFEFLGVSDKIKSSARSTFDGVLFTVLDRGDTPVKKWEMLPFFGLCLLETGVFCDWVLAVKETGLAPPVEGVIVAGFLDRKDFMLTVLSSMSTNLVATIDKLTTDGVLKERNDNIT